MSESRAGAARPNVLTPELLAAIHGRAPEYDRRNEFFHEDLAELAAAGYLRAAVPTELGGLGLSLAEMSAQQRLLAAAAPATALAVNMHQVWVTVARYLHDNGDHSLDFVLTGAAAGEVYAFGVSEAGNDLVLFDSDTVAEPAADGGYRFTGTKIFTSLSPAWTSLGTMGRDNTSPDAPRLVFGFVSRDENVVHREDWDTVGMRASQSRTTELHGAHAPAEHVVRRLEIGPSADPLIFGIFAMFEILLASVYTGIAERALEIAVDTVRTRRSKKTGLRYADDPDIRWQIASAGLILDGILPQLHALAGDVDARAAHGARWFALLSGLKHRAVEAAREVVDHAIRVSGGSSYFSAGELGRLYRDVLAGIFHPSDAESAHSTVAASLLGPIRHHD
ncbi:acyl-CoA dehydrogenase family protein [Mycetocola spongiae]|uniref:acyl-CoA dehydrogenase family protein n=1 Tax=Mycetocola spongiae TaxID=2859226 RepID=UPI001CF537DC|nr:acyl-CoA dehydrogenase family protein [Mycetocola spongiae]UCR88905.1 acyl-CoA/acyl-ACP dehydrogenase [Mycetocola spongiae]